VVLKMEQGKKWIGLVAAYILLYCAWWRYWPRLCSVCLDAKRITKFLIRWFILSLRFQRGTFAVLYKMNCVVSSLSMFLELFYSLFSEFLIFFFLLIFNQQISYFLACLSTRLSRLQYLINCLNVLPENGYLTEFMKSTSFLRSRMYFMCWQFIPP